ncbi:putative ferrichrome ABC transporter substrate-binding protein [Actinacidiphila reveromycinica]|uniref:Putative ferrichrome ABC transporter substrate-binding protein n=1 Tax=Actinacidiphila reveromycinica TaxID=659352 RepID=A0A7U3UPU7_9ACTN|nr:ABC transporter substrate-binding protein [Streptomyces sp. SN-593]BBA96513.1 putative ferrichrome ABC transporter substrate-binding protein [Streptomyces sp. SN-593]
MTRRGALAAGGSVGLGALLAACGGSSDSGSDPAASSGGTGAKTSSGPWSFTDDRKQTVKADHAPGHLVAYIGSAAALHDYGIECTGVFGPTTLKDGSADPMAGDVDVKKVTVIGNTWGEFNIEKYAALDPGLLISHMYQAPALWYVPDDSSKKILALAPSVGINVAGVPITTPLQRYAELAESLGADMSSGANAAQKTRFEKSSAALRAAAKAHPDITVMAGSASADSLYVSDPAAAADLRYYKSLGVNFIVPNKVTGGFFETLSWENADKYRSDVIMLDSRTATLQPKDLTGKPTWTRLPAVKGDQVLGWPSEPIFSYAKCADRIDDLTKAITSAKKVA